MRMELHALGARGSGFESRRLRLYTFQVEPCYGRGMANFVCKHCGRSFWSKHSTAQYCSRACSARDHREVLIQAASKPVYTDEDLLQFLIERAQALGRTPVKLEM